MLVFCFMELAAQQPASAIDIDQLTDQQLVQYMNQANLSGLSEADLETKARAKGLTDDQITKLKARVAMLNNKSGATGSDNSDSYERDNAAGGRLSRKDSLPDKTPKSKVFGAEFFSNQNLTFEPNLKIATPSNYILGPGDKVNIDIYGYSEVQYRLEVSPDGFIRIPNIGPVLVSGLSMEEAKVKVKRQLSRVYGDMNNGKTSFQMLLGTIRSISVTLIGEVIRPGTYTLPSLATIANALYVSGGPSLNGSFRAIDLVRNGKKVVSFDFYDFLLHGDLSKNRILRDQDVIRVNAYTTRVELSGAVKRKAIFEVKENENLADVIRFSGGFADTANKELVTVYRVSGREKEIENVAGTDLASFALQTGDSIAVNGIINRFKNRVSIQGAVFYEGNYSLMQAPSLKELLLSAQLKESAFRPRGVIRRLQEDYTPSFINFNINDILSGKQDIPLLREDSVHVYDITDIREKYMVRINGEVNSPGEFNFADSMKLQDLILAAGGFKDGASDKRLEIARRIRNSDTSHDSISYAYAIVKVVDINKDYTPADVLENYTLQPFDVVSVRRLPNYKAQVTVKIDGEVNYPGEYTIQSRTERLSDLVKRAGGLKSEAYPVGALLVRNTFEMVKDTSQLTIKSRMLSKLSTDTTAMNQGDDELARLQKPVGIRLRDALQKPGSLYDIYLEEGDILTVPKQLQTVQTFGAVSVAQKIVYWPGMRLSNAVEESGGYAIGAIKRRSYVVQANGEVRARSGFLFFRSDPRLSPGAEVYVPARRRSPLSEIASIGAAFASITGLIISLIYLFKN
jgi:protein involved in polysaccharide export with SLBB domain